MLCYIKTIRKCIVWLQNNLTLHSIPMTQLHLSDWLCVQTDGDKTTSDKSFFNGSYKLTPDCCNTLKVEVAQSFFSAPVISVLLRQNKKKKAEKLILAVSHSSGSVLFTLTESCLQAIENNRKLILYTSSWQHNQINENMSNTSKVIFFVVWTPQEWLKSWWTKWQIEIWHPLHNYCI